MATYTADDGSVGELLRQVADDGVHLARQEVALARIEFATVSHSIGTGAGFAVAAAMTGVLVVQMLLVGIVLALGDALLRGRYWMAAFALALIMSAVMYVLLRRAQKLLSPKNLATHLSLTSTPEQST
jgi:hypothetical protein